ncbi:sigma-70 family RNA polymerase sigma factor [Rubellimicrobium aerolatum]|uniref:Sigma-70 family RNA polymerase sigma factor n=1 Tax=Rubellimicrobium aerolatum TaxID=490979 RepID=A0ABW0S5W6_9RHOB|nr:sigma-70 family RNA polymerase sigma factor [Rubellimicrobium aerolatum]MBP1804591.1 RNA polymerase sigma-70 factor (ECF subfamily) [Rubellimicrobium aerolatum]
MTRLTDIEDMIARMALGDRRALSALYDATSAKLFGVALRVLNDRSEAEDALQEIYVKLWRNADRYRVNGLSPMTWLITVARNHAIDRLRARRASRAAPIHEAAEVADGAPNPEEAMLAAAERGRIGACLGTLPPDRADAIRRAYLGGEAYADLSRRYGVPLNTVRTWLRRGLLKLRECMAS